MHLSASRLWSAWQDWWDICWRARRALILMAVGFGLHVLLMMLIWLKYT